MAGHGTFIWNELVTTDPDRAKTFYRDILGWSYEDVDVENPRQPPPGGGQAYTICRAGDAMAGGMMKMEGPEWEGVPAHWISYVRVDDVDAAVAKVGPGGGRVKRPPFEVPTVGRIAVVADPSGAVLCLMTPFDQGAD